MISPPFASRPRPELREITPPEATLSPTFKRIDPPVNPEVPTERIIPPAEPKLSLVAIKTDPESLWEDAPVCREISPLINPDPLDTSTDPPLADWLLPLDRESAPPSPNDDPLLTTTEPPLRDDSLEPPEIRISPPTFVLDDEDPDSIVMEPARPVVPRPLAILISPPTLPKPLTTET